MADGSGWIDIHGRYYAPLTHQQAERRFKAAHEACFLTSAPPALEYDQEGVLVYLDRAAISMQMLSVIPKTLEALTASNDYGTKLVKRYPLRFGLLAALPTDDADAGGYVVRGHIPPVSEYQVHRIARRWSAAVAC